MELELRHSYDAGLDRVLGAFFDETHIHVQTVVPML